MANVLLEGAKDLLVASPVHLLAWLGEVNSVASDELGLEVVDDVVEEHSRSLLREELDPPASAELPAHGLDLDSPGGSLGLVSTHQSPPAWVPVVLLEVADPGGDLHVLEGGVTVFLDVAHGNTLDAVGEHLLESALWVLLIEGVLDEAVLG